MILAENAQGRLASFENKIWEERQVGESWKEVRGSRIVHANRFRHASISGSLQVEFRKLDRPPANLAVLMPVGR